MNFLQVIRAMVKKELYLYFIGTGFFTVSIVFSIGLFLLFRFTFPPEAITRDAAISLLWAVHLVSTLFVILAGQEWEWEKNAFRAIKLSGTDGYTVFMGKSAAAIVALALLWSMELVLWSLLFASSHLKSLSQGGVEFSSIIVFLLQIWIAGLIATMGISFLGQIASVVALHSRFKHVLLFILIFPLSLPVIIAAGAFTRTLWVSQDFSSAQGLIFLELSFTFLFLGAGVFLYDYLWEE